MGKNNLEKIIIVLIIALSGCANPGIKNLDAKGSSIICFGDSVTFGYGANPGEDYPTALGKMVKLPLKVFLTSVRKYWILSWRGQLVSVTRMRRMACPPSVWM